MVLQIARANGSLGESAQLPVETPLRSFPAKLKLATAISLFGSASVRVAVTQSRPQSAADSVMNPFLVATCTDQSLAPGAIPTRPISLSSAPINPATRVPCPLGSDGASLPPLPPGWTHDVLPTTLRSTCLSTPVSRTATFTFTAPLPSPERVLLSSPSIRTTPTEVLCGGCSA